MGKYYKIIIVLILAFSCDNIFAQNATSEPTQWSQAPYRLYRIRNVWTFLQLDTIIW